ncbi:MAG: sulfatase-like hydrolase/transferase [Planctomycetota bacterium]
MVDLEHPNRREFVGMGLAGLATAALPRMASAALTPARRPNVVVFISDDQSEEDFGCLGGNALTPNFDRLAAQGMTFTNAHVSSSVCSPSRYALLTGRYGGSCTSESFVRTHRPGTMTRVENNVELEPDRGNLPRMLQQAGYRTGFVGKSHITHHGVLNRPQDWPDHGLETYARDADPRDPAVSAKMRHNHGWWAQRMQEHGFDEANAVYAGNLRELYNEHANVHNLEWTTHAACQFMERNKEQPFFLYVATTMPHGPYPWIQQNGKHPYSLDADPKITGAGYGDEHLGVMPTRQSVKDRVAAAGLDVRRRHHATWMDDAAGAMLNKLESLGIADDTLFLFLADHGSRRHGKTTCYDNGVKVPMFARYPRLIKPGSTCDELVQNIDFAPTVLDLAGVPKDDADHDGASFSHVLGDSKAAHHDDLFFELGFSRGVKTKRWKYIAIRYPERVQAQIARGEPFAGWQGSEVPNPYLTRNQHLGFHAAKVNPNYFDLDQLYDLDADPREERNIAADHPEVIEAMKARLAKHLGGFENRPFGEFT